jgi:mRNA interferase MazF
VIIISNDAHIRGAADVIVVAMTSRAAFAPYSFQISSGDLVEGALNRPGTVRVDKIYTLAKAIIVKKFGKVSPAIIHRIRQTLDVVTTPNS